jgi:DNA repair exonuclease SbcCD ATPase subunit
MLSAANDEVDRSNKNCQDLQQEFDQSQKELHKSNKILSDLQEGYNHAQNDLLRSQNLVQELRARVKELGGCQDDLTEQINESNYELQLLKDAIDALNEENAALKEGCGHYEHEHPSPEHIDSTPPMESLPELPAARVMRSTVAEEPDQTAQEVVYSQPPLFPGPCPAAAPLPCCCCHC